MIINVNVNTADFSEINHASIDFDFGKLTFWHRIKAAYFMARNGKFNCSNMTIKPH